MTRHTPGPWSLDGSTEGSDLDVIDPSGRVAMMVCDDASKPDEQVMADALLVAAAPALLSALLDIVSCCDANCGDSLANAINDAREAIAFATRQQT